METALFASTFTLSSNPSVRRLSFRLPPFFSANLSPPPNLLPGLLKSLSRFRSPALFSPRRGLPGSHHYSCLLQGNSVGLALLSVTTNAKVKIRPFVATLAANPTFVSGLLAWFFAQSIKIVLNFFVERKWDLRILFASGGMPSSHSALCTALTTSVALCHGVSDSLFPVCLGFSSIVMYDAIGVRRHAGMQAENGMAFLPMLSFPTKMNGWNKFSFQFAFLFMSNQVLNMIVEDLFQGHPISQRKLKELLGHTPSQVLGGALLGILVACICCRGCLVAT